ncbi:MAG: adenylate/guanylate cyclase domain-containing protein [Hyphomicrobiales bacterium]
MTVQRKLAAILAADVVGFSRLTGADEERTLARLRALRSDVMDPTIAVHNGRVVKRTGDGVLVEFRSVVDAVRCGIEIQNAMLERNAGVAADRRIEFRIGIHLGDVVEESDGDLMGDGVNIAARLEGIASPGAICLSEDAYRQVKSRIDLLVHDLGSTHLKNIAEAIKVYALQVGITAPAAESRPRGAPAEEPAGKPSIAVLPFTNMSDDPEQEYFVDGMVEDIITALSRFNQLLVIARNTTFTYKGRAVDIRQVAKELGVRYVLEGGVRKSGNRLRITGQLIDATTGAHLWAERYDGVLEDVFDLQDKITAHVVSAIEPTIRRAEIERARRKPADNLDAYDLFLRALPHIYAVRPDENLEALVLLNQAIDLDPDYGPALAHAGWCLVQRFTRDWPAATPDDRVEAGNLARRALAAAGDDAGTIGIAGFVLVMSGTDYGGGLDAVHRAVAQNPRSGAVLALAFPAMIFGDDLEGARLLLDRALALSSSDPNLFLNLTLAGLLELFSGRPEAAVVLLERSIALNPNWDSPYWVMVAAYVQLGRQPAARAALSRFRELLPGATVSMLRRALPIRNADRREMVMAALRDAGLPD